MKYISYIIIWSNSFWTRGYGQQRLLLSTFRKCPWFIIESFGLNNAFLHSHCSRLTHTHTHTLDPWFGVDGLWIALLVWPGDRFAGYLYNMINENKNHRMDSLYFARQSDNILFLKYKKILLQIDNKDTKYQYYEKMIRMVNFK